MNALPTEYVEAVVRELPGWEFRDDALHCSIKFGSFGDAMAFIFRAAFVAQELNHHPEWTNVYDRVVLRLTTHDAGNRVSVHDITLARQLQAIRTEQKWGVTTPAESGSK